MAASTEPVILRGSPKRLAPQDDVCGWPNLPPQLPRQRLWRMAEQLLYRGRVELVDALEFLGVDAAGHEQAIDPETVGAGEIGPHRIADRQHAAQLNRMTSPLGGKLDRALINRPVRPAVGDP